MREGRRTDSWVDPTSVIGRDEDKKTLVSKVISEEGSVTSNVRTICILGMGGLGKTTLAKSVFNDEKVKEHFGGKCMWVCVGEVFKWEVIMESMIESMKSMAESLGENTVLEKSSRTPKTPREQLAEMLKDRIYLLILDDVWNEDYLKWEPLWHILNQGEKGSKIVITTRKKVVADKIRSAYTHELKGLNEDECLSIFKKVVVEEGKEEEYELLMDIGKQIVGKCGGLPLAVKTVASALRGRELTREQWEMVQNSKIWDLKESDNGILPALMLSYIELTPQQKNCFRYCSIFEKDTRLKKDELIRLWVSQGYIVVSDGRRDDEVGEECFNELLTRSMFQEPERDDDGTIIGCKMHDLVHDLAQWVTKEECRIILSSDANNNNNALSQLAGARHCVVRKKVSIGDIKLAGVKNLRTLIYSPNVELDENLDALLKLLKSVRVLNLRNCSVRHHSWKYLGKLVHLRHLHLSGPGLTQLPAASIAKLKELRYLFLSTTDIKNLPENIVSLTHLRVISLESCYELEELPQNIGTLSSLRQLNVKRCTKLKKLPNGIASLPQLQVINLSGCTKLKELPQNIGTVSSLRQLNVEKCIRLEKLPNGIVSLPHLQVINLSGCTNLKELPQNIGTVSSLRQLNVESCIRLEKLPNGIGSRKDLVVRLDRFPVEANGGDERGGCSRSNIGELGGTNIRAKYLRIWNLEEVGSIDEARTAKLEEKTSLTVLTLSWNEKDDVIAAAAADGVLEGLRPPPHFSILEIYNYPGQTFPSWMEDWGAAFCHLRGVTLMKCKNCTQLPALGQLPSLGMLTIAELDGVARVGREFFGGPSPTFPCLKELTFRDMSNWSEWVAISGAGEEGSAESPIMPALERLKFIDCPKLEAMPPIFTTSLRRLTVNDSSPMLYHRSSLHFLPFPLCETIAIIGDTHDPYYDRVSLLIDDTHDPLICVVIGEKATELLGSLVLHHTALRILILAGLPLLRSLPEELTQLTALEQLIILKCPELSGRCQIGGELWPKIVHIPHIQIDGEDIQSA